MPESDGRTPVPCCLRGLRSGDLGWVVHRHGVLYAREYGWGADFEGLVAGVVAEFTSRRGPRDRFWIAEREGAIVGAVCLVSKTEHEAQLRLLYVEPAARGLGVGRLLVRACIHHAREEGFGTLSLWTNSVLAAARRVYEREGFKLVSEAPHDRFGHGLVGQTWALNLQSAGKPAG